MSRTDLKRTSMYAGGSSPGKLLEAQFYHEDCLVYDLEDSVAQGEKDAARFLVYQMVRYHRPKDKYVIVRVNGIYSDYIEQDLEAVVRARPDALRIPKVERAEEVNRIDQRVAQIEVAAGIPVGSTELWCNIESALGVANANEIAAASPRVVALALGAEDYTASLGARRSKSGWEIFYARMKILEACRIAGISAQDAVFSDINDLAGLQNDIEMTRGLGFDGKTVVHPLQVDEVNKSFTPTEKEIVNAQRILRALREGEERHTGVVVVDGSMVDKPMEIRAKAVLLRARAAGMVGEEET